MNVEVMVLTMATARPAQNPTALVALVALVAKVAMAAVDCTPWVMHLVSLSLTVLSPPHKSLCPLAL